MLEAEFSASGTEKQPDAAKSRFKIQIQSRRGGIRLRAEFFRGLFSLPGDEQVEIAKAVKSDE
jgi:hypothetical protein